MGFLARSRSLLAKLHDASTARDCANLFVVSQVDPFQNQVGVWMIRSGFIPISQDCAGLTRVDSGVQVFSRKALVLWVSGF